MCVLFVIVSLNNVLVKKFYDQSTVVFIMCVCVCVCVCVSWGGGGVICNTMTTERWTEKHSSKACIKFDNTI